MTKDVRVVPAKNYIFLGIIMLVSIFLIYYLFLWYKAYEDSKINTPVMNKYLQVINYNELSSYLLESDNTIIYVSVVGNENIRDFEKEFKNTVIKYSLNDILYMDVSDELNSGLSLDYDLSVNNIPCILVFEGDRLIDTYKIDVKNYNMKKIRKYLVALGDNDED